MGFLDKILKYSATRSLSEEQEALVNNKIREYISDTGYVAKSISEEGALGLSAVWACVRVLSETVSTLPIHLYKRIENGREVQYDHPAYNVLQKPNSHLNRYDIFYHLMVSCTLWGNGYIRIYRDKYYKPIRLELLLPSNVEPTLTENKELFYKVNGGELLNSFDVIHLKGLSFDGVKGKSPIAVHKENLCLTQSAQEYGEKFFTQGGNMSGVLYHPSTLDDGAYKRLKNDLTSQMIGLNKAHKPLLLEGGMKYERISIPPEDAQFIATRKFQKTEIATIYGVPPHMIADLERSTNNNIEHQAIEFVNYCLMPYLVKIESELNCKLLTEKEFTEYYYKFNVNALQRGDSKSRAEYYKVMYMISTFSPNEIRAYEDMNSYDGGDDFYTQLNMQVVGTESINSENNTK